MRLLHDHFVIAQPHLWIFNYYNSQRLASNEKSALLTARYVRRLYIVSSEILTLLCWSEMLPRTTVWRSLNSNLWCLPQRTRWPPHCCRLSKLLYTRWRTAFNYVHTLCFWHCGIQVFTLCITDTCLYNHYTDIHMNQCFHTSRWKILHLSFCKQVFSTWPYYSNIWINNLVDFFV